MKKILALVLAMAFISVFAVIPAFAADTMVFKLGTAEINAGEDGTVTLDFAIDVTADTMGMTMYGTYDFYLNVPEGVTLTGAALADDNTYTWTNETRVENGKVVDNHVYINDASAKCVDFTTNPEYSKLVLTFVVDDTSKAAEYDITFDRARCVAMDLMDGSDAPTGYVDGKIVVKAAAPAVKTVAKTDYKIVESATTIGGKTTDTQIGAAVGIQFTAPDGVALQNQMIWAVETSDGRKYSKAVDVDFSGITGTVTVAATFHNGIHENSFDVATVAPLSITGVDAIFTDGTNDYFTNAADKDAKAE